jgi:mannose-1-phosphate guanylyltransferase
VKDSRNCVIYASDEHVVGVVGMDDVVVVHTPDATLVVPASRAQEVRDIVAELGDRDWSEYL